MKATELRIGNYIRGVSDHLKEERFTPATLVDLEYANLFEGIPLSEEWLLKLGFKLDAQECYSRWHKNLLYSYSMENGFSYGQALEFSFYKTYTLLLQARN